MSCLLVAHIHGSEGVLDADGHRLRPNAAFSSKEKKEKKRARVISKCLYVPLLLLMCSEKEEEKNDSKIQSL